MLKHGLYKSKIYRIWHNMKKRCYYVKSTSYNYYGKKGIGVCDDWHNFKNFVIDMGFPPSPIHTLDRIDSEGDYEPRNCRWATPKEQANNRTNNCYIYVKGVRYTLATYRDYLSSLQLNLEFTEEVR